MSIVKAEKPADRITFVCCIEFGRLEEQTILMIETLRRFGGALSDARVLVVQGRIGAPLSRESLDRLRELDCELITASKDNPAAWFNYSNKVAAVAVSQRMATTPLVAWLDSDILVASEPTALLLADDEDFAARSEWLPPAITEGDQRNVPYWKQLCEVLEVRFSDLPWMPPEEGRRAQRMYLNSGVFVWRRDSNFAATYSSFFRRLLASRLAQHDGMYFTADQVILGPVILKTNLRWKHLSGTEHHMIFQGLLEGPSRSPPMNHSSLVHYSRSMNEPYRAVFMDRLASELPHVHDLVVAFKAPVRRSVPRQAAALLLRMLRGSVAFGYSKSVKRAPLG